MNVSVRVSGPKSKWRKTSEYFLSLMLSVVRSLTTFWANLLVSLIVNVRLAWNKKNGLHVLQDELNRPWSPEELVCVYAPSGRRTYFVKSGRLTPQVLFDGKSFEKMKTSKKTAFGRLVGDAATAAGDDPVFSKQAKSILRSKMSCPGSGVLRILDCVGPAVKAMLEQSQGAPVSLYQESLRACLIAVFPTMMGTPLESCIPSQTNLDEILHCVDRVANAGVEAKDPKHDWFFKTVVEIFQAGFDKAPEGSFGRSLLSMKDGDIEIPLSASFANATFYWNALSTVSSTVIYHFVLMMVRHPHHWQKALEDRDHFRRCLKETLRLFSPVSGLMPRRSRRDVKVGSTIIPRSSFVVVMPTLQTKDVDFEPDRWMENDSIIDAQYEDVVYAPFSSGPRACLMRSYGADYLENLVWDVVSSFDFDLLDEDVLKNEHPTKHHISDIGIAFRPSQDYRYSFRSRR